MAYWLDDGFDTWPEVIRAGSAAVGLYVRCGAWIARNPTDGHVPAEVAAMYGTPEWVAKLVAVGLWETEEAGYRDVYYLVSRSGVKLNPTAEKVLQQKAQKAERQRRWLDKQKETRTTPGRRVSSQSQGASRGALGDLPPSLPPLKGRGVRPRERGATHPNTQTHTPNCPYPDRNPDTCSVCASERKAPPTDLVDQELPLPWPDQAETATPTPAPTPTGPPVAAPSAPPNAKAAPTPRRPRPPRPSTTTGHHQQPDQPPPSASEPPSPPAANASPPPPPETDTPAGTDWPIVLVLQTGREPVPAELREDNPDRPNVVKVVYLHSRTGAWVDRKRITPKPTSSGPELGDTVWIAAKRQLIQAHRPADDDLTACRRSMRTGHQTSASAARRDHGATWCTSCWPTPRKAAA